MLHISLFSGIGGFDLASEWMGWRNIVSCEINPWANKVLSHYWPDAYHHEDIHTLNYDTINAELSRRWGSGWRNEDIILTGGFPCQPYSSAGKRLGKEDARHLWPEMCRLIREIQPAWIVGENVLGLANWNGGLVFHEVQTDLEAEGYEVQPYVLPAAGINAPHLRNRIWFVAKDTIGDGRLFGEYDENGVLYRAQRDAGAGDTKRVCGEAMAGTAADCDNERLQGGVFPGWDGEQGWDRPKSSFEERIHPHGTFVERQGWENFPTESPVCVGDDGLPAELDGITFSKWGQESIKGYGNAVVPPLVHVIFKAIEKYRKEYGN